MSFPDQIVGNEEILSQISAEVLKRITPGIWIGLIGELGAGKTTLSKSLLKQVGVTEEVTSPSYGLVNEYKVKNQVIEHWDLYRLTSVPDDLVNSEADIVLIEWADKFPNVLNNCKLKIKIEIVGDLRKFSFFD